MICSARGENRAHGFLHLLLRSRPIGCSCSGRRRCVPCPLVHSEVLAPGQSKIPSLSDYHSSDLCTKVRSRNLLSSARGIPDVFVIKSESNAELHPVTQAHV